MMVYTIDECDVDLLRLMIHTLATRDKPMDVGQHLSLAEGLSGIVHRITKNKKEVRYLQ